MTIDPTDVVRERWWQRSAVRAAIGAVVLLFLPALHSLIVGEPVDRERLASAVESGILIILAAFGITATDRNALRLK